MCAVPLACAGYGNYFVKVNDDDEKNVFNLCVPVDVPSTSSASTRLACALYPPCLCQAKGHVSLSSAFAERRSSLHLLTRTHAGWPPPLRVMCVGICASSAHLYHVLSALCSLLCAVCYVLCGVLCAVCCVICAVCCVLCAMCYMACCGVLCAMWCAVCYVACCVLCGVLWRAVACAVGFGALPLSRYLFDSGDNSKLKTVTGYGTCTHSVAQAWLTSASTVLISGAEERAYEHVGKYCHTTCNTLNNEPLHVHTHTSHIRTRTHACPQTGCGRISKRGS